MKIALFDLYTSGHHFPYASRIRQALETESDHDVTFVTLTETERCTQLFDSDEVVYLDSPESPPIEDRDGSFDALAESILGEFCSGHILREYDIVHFLYADTILAPLWRHCSSTDGVRFFAELNGTFFHRGTILRRRYLHQAFLWLLQSPAVQAIDLAVPDRTSHESLWRDLYLSRTLRDETFDHMIVHSQEASEYLTAVAPRQTDRIGVVPYPAPENFGTSISQHDARQQLGFQSDDPVLLFFGSMRGEKGIHFLLNTLQQYSGPCFTMVLAGPPVVINEDDLQELGRNSPIKIIHKFGYIDRPELYYRAADAVILPYERKYGKERPSQLFQEVCSSLRPVIVPDFGTFGRLTEQWDLGETYKQGSISSLIETLAAFANDGVSFSKSRMQEYNKQHSYERIAIELSNLYQL